jgi:hypothetical protein
MFGNSSRNIRKGFGHPGQFVSGQKAHREARLDGMNCPACSFGRGVNLQ